MSTTNKTNRHRGDDATERRARRRIERALRRAGRRGCIDDATARLIAATIHSGPGSALERFAATSELSARGALIELEVVPVGSDRGRWVRALRRFVRRAADAEGCHGAA